VTDPREQREPEKIAVKADRALEVGRDEREMIDAPEHVGSR